MSEVPKVGFAAQRGSASRIDSIYEREAKIYWNMTLIKAGFVLIIANLTHCAKIQHTDELVN